MSDDDHAETDGGTPSNAELAERMARVEANQQNFDAKLGNQLATLERIEARINEDLDQKADRLDCIEPRNQHLWTVYNGAKWLTMYLSGGGVLALIITALLGV